MAVATRRTVTGGLVTAALLAACGTVEPSPAPPTATPLRTISEAPSPSPSATPQPVTLADAGDCPVTQPTTTPPEIGDGLFGSHAAYGNDDLWVGGLGESGIMALSEEAVDPSDGSIGTKLGWWRNVPGHVEISGRRLDADAPPLSGEASPGLLSTGFQSSGVHFPTEGCWEITGSIGESELTFVAFVIVSGEA